MSATVTAAAAPLRVEALAGLEALEGVAAEWERLCARVQAEPLVRPEWILAQARAFEHPRRLRTLVVRTRSGELTAVLALVWERRFLRGAWVRSLRSVAGGNTLRFDLVCAPDALAAAAAALWAYLAAWRAWTVLELHEVPAAGNAEALVAAAAAAGYPTGRWRSMDSPFLRLDTAPPPPGAPALAPGLRATRAGFRHQLRRTRRRLQAQGELRLEAISAPSADDLDGFFRLEAAGRKGGPGGKAVLRKGAAARRFFCELAARAAARGGFVLHRLLLAGVPIAASFSLVTPQGYFAIKWCYDESYAAFGPGHLMIESILEECAASGRLLFDFTGPSYPYKRQWTASERPHAFLLVFRAGVWGRLLHWMKFGARRRLAGFGFNPRPPAAAAGPARTK